MAASIRRLKGAVESKMRERRMNIALWVVQVLLGVVFLGQGILKFAAPDGLPAMLSWVYDVTGPGAVALGVAELAAAAGMILPGLTGIQPRLTSLAALGLVVVMAGAIVFHVGREEYQQIGFNVLLLVMAGFVAYGRWRLVPVKSRSHAA